MAALGLGATNEPAIGNMFFIEQPCWTSEDQDVYQAPLMAELWAGVGVPSDRVRESTGRVAKNIIILRGLEPKEHTVRQSHFVTTDLCRS